MMLLRRMLTGRARCSMAILAIMLVSVHTAHAQSCKSADSETASMLADLQHIADTTDASHARLRAKLKMPATNAAQITLVADDSTCARARQALDSLIHATNMSAPNPLPVRPLYVIRVGSVTAVRDPNGKAGEYSPIFIFDPFWSFSGSILY